MKLSQLKKIIKETIKEVNNKKQPLNEEKNFMDCQVNWVRANGVGIMEDHANPDGSYDIEGAFRAMFDGAMKACKHLLNVRDTQVMTKN